MPSIVNLSRTPRPRKRPGRDLAAVQAAYAVMDLPRPVAVSTAGAQPHISYNPDIEYRTEHARHLSPWARARVGVGRFTGYYHVA